jgi:hypothetical protein
MSDINRLSKEELQAQVYICSDCGLETNRWESSEIAAELLPDKICQSCLIDLLDGRYAGGDISVSNPWTKEEKLLAEIFGNDEIRIFRKGSSQKNIDYLKNRNK